MGQGEKRVGIFMQLCRYEESMHNAIRNVLAQTYTNFKFYIMVSDKTREVVEKYAMGDERIEILKEAPLGAWEYDKYIAGDDNDYFAILDADDFFVKEYLEESLKFAEEYNTDITACGNYFIKEDGAILGKRTISQLVWDTKETNYFLGEMHAFFRTMWGKLIKSEVVLQYDKTNLPKSESYGGYGGDTMYMFNLLPKTKKLGIMDKALYVYTISSTSDSRKIRAGRLDSDTIVFRFVEGILKRFDGYGETQRRFLFLVFANAIDDTIKVILAQTEKEGIIDKLLYVFQAEYIPELLERIRNGGLQLPGIKVKDYIKEYYELIYQKVALFRQSNSVQKYLKLYETLYSKCKGIFSTEEFSVLLENKLLLDAFTEGQYNRAFELLLSELQRMQESQREIGLQLLRRTTKNGVARTFLKDVEFVICYKEFFKLVNLEQATEFFERTKELFSKEILPDYAEMLADFWINYAALVENIEEYIFAREMKTIVLVNNNKISEAKAEMEELRLLGVMDENMECIISIFS